MKSHLSPLFSLFCVLSFLFSCNSPQEKTYLTWSSYSGDPTGSKYSSLDQINRKNVSQLEPAWVFCTGDKHNSPSTTIECNPIVVDSTMYITSPGLEVIALNAATGEEQWRFDHSTGESARGVNRIGKLLKVQTVEILCGIKFASL